MKCECGNEDLLYLSHIEEPLKRKIITKIAKIIMAILAPITLIAFFISANAIFLLACMALYLAREITELIKDLGKAKIKVKCICKKCDKIITIEAKEEA